jgi:hypothetical protein
MFVLTMARVCPTTITEKNIATSDIVVSNKRLDIIFY